MCGGGQGGRSQGVQVLVRTHLKRLHRVSGLGGPGRPRRREETLRAKRGMDAHTDTEVEGPWGSSRKAWDQISICRLTEYQISGPVEVSSPFPRGSVSLRWLM